jgi:hypothetical protein
MLAFDPLHTLALAQEHGRHLRAEAAAERLRPAAETRRSLAAVLRRAADLLDPAPLAPRPAGQS